MNKTSRLAVLLCLLFASMAAYAESTYYQVLTPAVAQIAANTTNSTVGTLYQVSVPQRSVRLFASCTGAAGGTNATMTVYFVTADGDESTTNSWDTATQSPIKLKFTDVSGAANQVSDRFDLSGVRYLAVGRIENGFGIAVSNLTFHLSYISGQGSR